MTSKILSDFFSHIKVNQFPQTAKNNGKVIVVGLEDPLKDAMKKLCANRIYSAPVFDKETSQYVGMIDMGDIVDFIAENFEQTQTLGKGFEAIFEQAEMFIGAKVLDIIKASRRTTFVPISGKASMLQVSMLFKEHGVHRVNVFDDDEKLVNIITKSAVVEQLHKHHELLGDNGNKTPPQLNLGTSPVISIDISEPTIKAFQLLRKSRLYAVPVVNKQLQNAIVSTISVKDVREVCFDPSRIHMLYSPISQFLSQSNEESVDIVAPSVTCKDSDPLKLIIDKLVINKIHRVYVLDPVTHAPKKAISLTDILNCLC